MDALSAPWLALVLAIAKPTVRGNCRYLGEHVIRTRADVCKLDLAHPGSVNQPATGG